ncbi:MAG: PAS domain S-box protein [Chromatiales bacterium]|nr:PAS domain S-box protein [Chromatiales bacterium]
MHVRIPIKYLLPLILLIFSVASTALIYLYDRTRLTEKVTEQMTGVAADRLTGMQGTLELLLELDEHNGVSRQLAAFSGLPDNVTLLITDAQGRVIASNRQADRSRHITDRHPEISTSIMTEVITRRTIETRLDEQGRWLDAYASVCTRGSGSLRSDSCGLLYHRLDLSYHQRIALQPLKTQTGFIAIAMTAASLLLGYLIHLMLFRRTAILAETVNRYAQGERSARSGLIGGDEIAHLAGNVDAMMGRIEADEQALRAKEQRLKTLFNSVRDPIVVTTLEGKIISFNHAAEKLFGYSTGEVYGRNINILMPQRDQQTHDSHLLHYRAGVRNSTVIGKGRELIACNAGGEEFPVEVTITEMRDSDELQLIGVIRDISERVEAEQQMRLSQQVFEAAGEAIVITDADTRIIDVNPAYEEITGYSREEMIGEKPSKIKSNRYNHEFYEQMWESINRTGSWSGEIWDRRKGGETFPKWLNINSIRNAHGEVSHYVGIFSDITAQKAVEEQLEQLAYYDPLTKLPNRALYRDRLERELLQVQRRPHISALLFIDLDKFKQVNDTLGHDIGDELLIAVAERLTGCVRASDTVCRLGGDEFTVILSDVEKIEGITRVASGIIEQLQQPFILQGHEVEIGGSIGIALMPQDATDFVEINKKADIAMYHAKASGRGNYQFYTEGLNG